jgi:hypothetical protein
MNANLIWPVAAILGLGLLGLGLAYGMGRAGGPRRGDAAADAGAKAPLSPAARYSAAALTVLGAILLLGSGIAAWQYEARSGVKNTDAAGAANVAGTATRQELAEAVGPEAPVRGVQGDVDARKAQQAQDFANRRRAAQRAQEARGAG